MYTEISLRWDFSSHVVDCGKVGCPCLCKSNSVRLVLPSPHCLRYICVPHTCVLIGCSEMCLDCVKISKSVLAYFCHGNASKKVLLKRIHE